MSWKKILKREGIPMDLNKLRHIKKIFEGVGKPYLRRPIILNETLPEEVYEKVGDKLDEYTTSSPTELFDEAEAMGETYWRRWGSTWDKHIETNTTIEHDGETYGVRIKIKPYMTQAAIKAREKQNKEMKRRANWTEEQWAKHQAEQSGWASVSPPRRKPRRDNAIVGSHRKWKEDNTGYFVVVVFKERKALIRIDFRFVTTLRRPPEVKEPSIGLDLFAEPLTDEEQKDLDEWAKWYEEADKYYKSDEHKKYMKAWEAAAQLFMM